LDEQGVIGFGASFSNTGLLGIPLITITFGEAGTLPLFLLIAFHSLLMFPLVTAVVEAGRGRHEAAGRALPGIAWNILRGLAKNPIILGLLAGLVFNLLRLPIPQWLDTVVKTLSAAAAPCALFAMGATLSHHRIAGNQAEALTVVALKTLVHPLLVWVLATQVFQVAPLWAAVAVLMAGLPTGTNAYLLAQRYSLCVRTVTTATLLSTGLSVLSLSALLFLLNVR
ncbi:MAG: AEC family transporter, partial [Pseudomonadota bacterium]|nr:AEC family transporter [Pseudomonadota bacterium]